MEPLRCLWTWQYDIDIFCESEVSIKKKTLPFEERQRVSSFTCSAQPGKPNVLEEFYLPWSFVLHNLHFTCLIEGFGHIQLSEITRNWKVSAGEEGRERGPTWQSWSYLKFCLCYWQTDQSVERQEDACRRKMERETHKMTEQREGLSHSLVWVCFFIFCSMNKYFGVRRDRGGTLLGANKYLVVSNLFALSFSFSLFLSHSSHVLLTLVLLADSQWSVMLHFPPYLFIYLFSFDICSGDTLISVLTACCAVHNEEAVL